MTLFGETCPCCGQPMPEQQETSFAAFWARCPNKVGKAQAEKAWRKLTPQSRAIASDNVARFYEWFAKTYTSASLMHPATYLNQKRWTDLDQGAVADRGAVVALHRANLTSSIPAVAEAAKRALINMGEFRGG